MARDADRGAQPLPKGMRDAPELMEHLQLYMDAFYELDTCRPIVAGFGGAVERGIPWDKIKEWAEFHGLSGSVKRDLFHHVRALDLVYLQWSNENRPKSK